MNTDDIEKITKKFRYWCESVVLGTTLQIDKGKLLDEKEFKQSLHQLITEERLDEHKSSMMGTRNYTEEELELGLKVGIFNQYDIDRLSELKEGKV